VVTSRAVAPLSRLLEWSMPLVAPDGAMLAMKGSSVAEELPEARETVARLCTTDPEILTLGAGHPGGPISVVRVAWLDTAAVSLPVSERSRRPSAAGDGRQSTGPQQKKRRRRT
jgi:16S rRNA (guanine527-N7)-methyltransferase